MGGAADELPRRDIHGTTAWSRSLHADDDDCHGSFQAELFGKLSERANYCQPNLEVLSFTKPPVRCRKMFKDDRRTQTVLCRTFWGRGCKFNEFGLT